MRVSYDLFKDAFLRKIRDFNLYELARIGLGDEMVDGYMKTACMKFNRICSYNLTHMDDENRELEDDIAEQDVLEIVDIVTDGMLVQWMTPYVYRQELLENLMNSRDFSTYSPGELLFRIQGAYKDTKDNYKKRMNEYSYAHGNLRILHT